jgi:predicted nucleic acid-binding protein
MLIVSDTSCITNLIQINQFNLLCAIYTQIIITPVVKKELQQFHLLSDEAIKDLNLTIQTPVNTFAVNQLMLQLDAGESESIILAEELNADFLLVDERKATKIANERGLTTIGILGVILLAKQKNYIASVKLLLDDLRLKTTFHFSDSLYTKILQLAGE